MKREKLSPTIENDKNPSKYKLGLGKKAAALILSGSVMTACATDAEQTPQGSETSISSEVMDQTSDEYTVNVDGLEISVTQHSYPELSPEAQKDERQYGSIEQFPAPIDISFISPRDGKLAEASNFSPESIEHAGLDEDGVLGIDLIYSYLPQIEQYSDRSRVIEVNGTEFDTERMLSDPAYIRAMLDPTTYTQGGMDNQAALKKTNTLIGEAVTALGLSEGDIVSEYIKAHHAYHHKLDPEQFVDKEYKILDENASNQEILDNFDIETAVISSIPSSSAKNRLASGSVATGTFTAGVDESITNAYRQDSKATIFNSHLEVQLDGHSDENLDPDYRLFNSPGSGNNTLHVRQIYATNSSNSSSTPDSMIFRYLDFGDYQKWVNSEDIQLTSAQWKNVQEKAEVEKLRNEFIN